MEITGVLKKLEGINLSLQMSHRFGLHESVKNSSVTGINKKSKSKAHDKTILNLFITTILKWWFLFS